MISSKAKIALSIAIAITTVTAATAASKHPVRHHRVAVEHQVPGADAYGYAGTVNSPYVSPSVLNADKREKAGDTRCWGGNCDPIWSTDDY